MTQVLKYRRTSVVVEALPWDGGAANATPVIDWVLSNGGTARYVDDPERNLEAIHLDTTSGVMRVNAGDFVVRGALGEFYPCRSEEFSASYVPEPDTPEMSDGDRLRMMGTDGVLWAKGLSDAIKSYATQLYNEGKNPLDCLDPSGGDVLHVWVTNAIMAGWGAGYSKGKLEHNPNWPLPAPTPKPAPISHQ